MDRGPPVLLEASVATFDNQRHYKSVLRVGLLEKNYRDK